MSLRHPSEGIAFEPLTALAGMATTLAAAVIAGGLVWHHLWKTPPAHNKEK